MDLLTSILLFIAGLALVVYFSEKLVEGTVGTSLGFGVSAFLVSVIFIGFDPENLALGAVASGEQVTGIAAGTIIGAAMVAIALALGITVLIAPMEFKQVSLSVLLIPITAVALLGILSVDGLLSRLDGIILLAGYLISILYLVRLSRKGLDIKAAGEVAEVLEKEETPDRWKSFGLMILSLAAIILGSEMLVEGSEVIIARIGLTDTVFGMTILALLVSIEELGRELPAALKGRPDISIGNVIGSVLAFFLFNAGIIALVRPLPISDQVLEFYLPVSIAAVVMLTVFMMTNRLSRWMGLLLLLLYALFFARGFL
ncbi:MAG: hypothetical protein R3211_00025 [Balneolaceae bacterium]|nr:hypothetical protein [Balneolaceae bacterium]